MVVRGAISLLVCLATLGCLGPVDTPPIRYFHPGDTDITRDTGDIPADAPQLRLRPVRAAPDLTEMVAWRRGPHERGQYDVWRWVAPPGLLVEQRLQQELFEARLLRQTTRGGAPTLEVQVWSFREDRTAGAAEVVLHALLLAGDGSALWQETLSAAQPVAEAGDPTALAAAFGQALDDAVTRLGTRVVKELRPPAE